MYTHTIYISLKTCVYIYIYIERERVISIMNTSNNYYNNTDFDYCNVLLASATGA